MNSEISQIFGHKLRLRVSGILIADDRILLVEHKSIGKSGILWAPPGGGMQYGEDAHTCLKREFKEETNLNVEVGQLLFVNEYFEQPLHALELFFEITHHSGSLVKGIDPELPSDYQIIKNVKFVSISEIKKSNPEFYHSIFQQITTLSSFKNLKGYYKNINLS